MADPAISTANFLAHCAGELPHKGGLKSSSIKAIYSRLKGEFAARGVILGETPWASVLNDVYRGLLARPDATIPREEKWDLQTLFQHWRSQDSNAALSVSELRLKATTLAMARGLARPSDLARLDRRTLQTSTTEVKIRAFLAKNSGSTYSEPLVFSFLPARDRQICPASALLAYLSRTQEIAVQHVDEHGVVPVFLSSNKPYGPLSDERISSAAKPLLRRLGINHRVYSIRNNATTTAVEAGVPLVTIQKHGRWRSAEVMQKHYIRSLSTAEVSKSIFSHRRK